MRKWPRRGGKLCSGRRKRREECEYGQRLEVRLQKLNAIAADRVFNLCDLTFAILLLQSYLCPLTFPILWRFDQLHFAFAGAVQNQQSAFGIAEYEDVAVSEVGFFDRFF